MQKLSDLSILGWLVNNNVKTEKGEKLDFKDRLFLLDILTDWSPEIVVKKCSQIGGSVAFNLKVLFGIKTFGWNVIYTFPTDSDVKEFVSSKTNKIIQSNQQVSWFKGLNTDNIERKEIADRFLFFKGTISKTAAIMTSADVLVHDEADRSDQKALETYKSRTKASPYKGRWIFSNPTTEKGIVDNQWLKSDKKEWHIKCPKCGLEQELRWPESIDKVRKIFICQGCKDEIEKETRRTGFWRATGKGKVSGYHITHLMASWISADDILKDSEGDQEYFYNFVLGEPYNPGDLSVTRSTILDCWTPKNLETGNWYLGVDVGNIKHWVLGSEKGVTSIGAFNKWQDLDDLINHYKPVVVIDAMPDNTMSKYYTETYRNAFMCYLNRDKEQNRVIKWGDKENITVIHADRNRLMDLVINEILNAKILFNIEANDKLRDYLRHWETLRRVKEINNLGIERYVWDSTNGEDHYCFATLFYYIAREAKGNGVLIDLVGKEPSLIKETTEGQFLNLKEILEYEN